MNKERFGLVVCLSVIVILLFISFVSSASAAKIDGTVKFRGYQYFAFSDGDRSEIYINKMGEVNLQRPSFGGMLTDYTFFDKKIGIVSADPAGNFILLDGSLKDLIGEDLFNQIDGREISENGLVGEQADSIELTINTNGKQTTTGIIADGRGYLRPKTNPKETIGTIDKNGKISMYNPSSYSTTTKTSLSKVANQIHNTLADNGFVNDLTKISNDGYASRSANARSAATGTTSSNNILDRIRRAVGDLVEAVTGKRPTPTPPEIPGITKPTPSPKPGPGDPIVKPGPTPSPKPTPFPKPSPSGEKCTVGSVINCGCVIPPKSASGAECRSVQFVGISYWECISSGTSSKWNKVADDCPTGTVGGLDCKGDGSDCTPPSTRACETPWFEQGTETCAQSGNVCKYGECKANPAGKCKEPEGEKNDKRRIDCEKNKDKTYYAQCVCTNNLAGGCSWKAVDEAQKKKDCIECAKDSDCKDSKKPACDTTNEKCVECTKNSHCTGNNYCDTEKNTCTEKCKPKNKQKQ